MTTFTFRVSTQPYTRTARRFYAARWPDRYLRRGLLDSIRADMAYRRARQREYQAFIERLMRVYAGDRARSQKEAAA